MPETELDTLFSALAHPDRRRMLDLLRETPGLTVAALGRHFDMSDVAVLKHVQRLAAAGLVHSHKQGRERKLFFNVMPIQMVYDRWTDQYSRFWAGRVADLKDRLESRSQQQTSAGKGRKSA